MKIVITIIYSFYVLILQGQALKQYDVKTQKMGTQFRIIFFAESDELANHAVKNAITRIDELNTIFSDYDPDSELSLLSVNAHLMQPVQLSYDLYKVLTLALELSEQSEGVFDVSIGPLSKLWRRAIRQQTFPEIELLEEKRALVGYQYIQILDDYKILFTKPNMRLDFGGIAKGYTVDEVYKSLISSGIRYALVDGGGDIFAGEHPEYKDGWPVYQDNESVFLKNEAIASSGGTYKFLVHEGVTYCHIIDPRTGVGIQKVKPVYIRAPSCILADGLASIAAIEGENKAKSIKDSLEIAAWVMDTSKIIQNHIQGFAKKQVN